MDVGRAAAEVESRGRARADANYAGLRARRADATGRRGHRGASSAGGGGVSMRVPNAAARPGRSPGRRRPGAGPIRHPGRRGMRRERPNEETATDRQGLRRRPRYRAVRRAGFCATAASLAGASRTTTFTYSAPSQRLAQLGTGAHVSGRPALARGRIHDQQANSSHADLPAACTIPSRRCRGVALRRRDLHWTEAMHARSEGAGFGCRSSRVEDARAELAVRRDAPRRRSP